MDLLFSGLISRPEFAADFCKTFGTFRHFGAPFGSPVGSLWLENGGLDEGWKKARKRGLRVIPSKPGTGPCLPLKKRIFDPLLPQRLAGFEDLAMASNTPCVPEGTVKEPHAFHESAPASAGAC